MLPPLAGRSIRVELRASLGPHLAATHIPRRVILLDAGLLEAKLGDQAGEFERILVNEIFRTRLVGQLSDDVENQPASHLECFASGVSTTVDELR